MNGVIGFIFGIFVGAFIGFVACGVLVANERDEKRKPK